MSARVQKLMIGREDRLRYAVLSERNSTNLEDGIASLWASWTRLRRSVHWKRKVKGAIVVLEVTYNRESRSWHPHLNVLIEGEYIPFEFLNKLWIVATRGNGRGSHIQAADQNSAFELIKYTLKVAERKENEMGEPGLRLILDRPEALDEYLSATYSIRLIRTYGTFFGQLAIEDESNPHEQCPDCGGSERIIDLGPLASHQLIFDFERDCIRIRDGDRIPIPRDVPGFVYSMWDENYQSLGERLHSMDKIECCETRKIAGRWIRCSKGIRLTDRNDKIAAAVQSRRKAAAYERSVSARLRAA